MIEVVQGPPEVSCAVRFTAPRNSVLAAHLSGDCYRLPRQQAGGCPVASSCGRHHLISCLRTDRLLHLPLRQLDHGAVGGPHRCRVRLALEEDVRITVLAGRFLRLRVHHRLADCHASLQGLLFWKVCAARLRHLEVGRHLRAAAIHLGCGRSSAVGAMRYSRFRWESASGRRQFSRQHISATRITAILEKIGSDCSTQGDSGC